MKAVAVDVAEGYVSVNPLFLKKFDKDMVKELYENLNKAMTATRNEKLDLTDQAALRMRNMRLQRLHNAMIILRNTAREKRIPL
ncbi:MAG: hypothetical protein A2010_06745 [Nitrospirae bacterium GWD2_57_9]|nr:MAG: hypothetical protein A2010_06745 [Nitrospirae bacterium GWD2_57_9]